MLDSCFDDECPDEPETFTTVPELFTTQTSKAEAFICGVNESCYFVLDFFVKYLNSIQLGVNLMSSLLSSSNSNYP